MQVLIKLRSSLYADEVVDRSSVKDNAKYSRSGYNVVIPHFQGLLRSVGFKTFVQEVISFRQEEQLEGGGDARRFFPLTTRASDDDKRTAPHSPERVRTSPDSESRPRKKVRPTEEKRKKKVKPSVVTSPDFEDSDSDAR